MFYLRQPTIIICKINSKRNKKIKKKIVTLLFGIKLYINFLFYQGRLSYMYLYVFIHGIKLYTFVHIY